MPEDLARQYPTRPEALAEFWRRSRQLSRDLAELRKLRAYVMARWGRCPRLPILGPEPPPD
jgi:hypothetical protein